jgi:hypothetical protein
MPLFKTNRIPVRVARSSMRGLPPLGLGGSSGKSGSITSHSSSVTSGLAIFSSYPPPGFVRRSKSLEEGHTVSSNSWGECPSTHPYRIPKINYFIRHPNTDGKVSNPLMVSAGADSWENYTSMHGDYFAANQDEFNNTLIDLCLRNVPDSVTVADPRCGEEP